MPRLMCYTCNKNVKPKVEYLDSFEIEWIYICPYCDNEVIDESELGNDYY